MADRATFYARLRIEWQTCPSRIDRACHLQRDTTPVGRTVGGRRSRTGHDRRRGTDSPTDQRPLLCDDEIPLIRGRVWSDSESAGVPHVAVVNQTMARELWPDESAIGRRVRIPEYIKITHLISGWRRPAATAGSRSSVWSVTHPMSVSMSRRHRRSTATRRRSHSGIAHMSLVRHVDRRCRRLMETDIGCVTDHTMILEPAVRCRAPPA